MYLRGENVASDFGNRLRLAREHKELTQIEVYKLTGINNKALSRYETNKTNPNPDDISTLAKLYDVSTDYLFGFIEKFKHPEPNSNYDREIQFIIEKYKDASPSVKKATRAVLDIATEEITEEIAAKTVVKKENIQ
jgi:transcriptional regulator with XRE-family HTH domain